MTRITRFEDLECWQQARILVKVVYEATKGKEFRKDLRLSGQIQAAATSAMANIAEGFIRRSDKEFIQFLFIAMFTPWNTTLFHWGHLQQRYKAIFMSR